MRQYAGDKVQCFSAGIAPSHVHPVSVQVMAEKGIDISKHHSKSVDELDLKKITIIATLCGEADEVCPRLSIKVPVLQWHFPDPCRAVGSEEDRLNHFRKVRDGIEEKVKGYLKSL